MVIEKIARLLRREKKEYKTVESTKMYSMDNRKMQKRISDEESLQHAYEVAEFFRKEQVPLLLIGSLPKDGVIAHNNHEKVIRLLEKHGEDKIARALHDTNIDIMPKKPVMINGKILLPLRYIAEYRVTGEPRSERAHGAIVVDAKHPILEKMMKALQSEEGRKIVARAILEATKREMEKNMRINNDRIGAISHKIDGHINILDNPKLDPRAYKLLLGMIKRWARQPQKY